MRIIYGEVRTGRVVVTAGSLQWVLDVYSIWLVG